MRASNGVVETSKIFGSARDDRIFDLKITFNGLYILALINNNFMPHKFNDRIWTT